MDFTPYEVVGPFVPLDVKWGGPKSIGGMVFWLKFQRGTALERVVHAYVGGGADKGKYQYIEVLFHMVVLEEERGLNIGIQHQLVHRQLVMC